MKKSAPLILMLIFFLIFNVSLSAQVTIKPAKGFDPHIGALISMLDDLKERITNRVEDLSQEETDFLLDDNANRIGAMILHLAATEKYYQIYTFEGRDFNAEEADWDMAQRLGVPARAKLVGQPISYYLKEWDKIRKETKRLLKTKDDKWLNENVNNGNMNNHWAWYHVMEHQANHMGQIAFLMKRM